MDGCFVRRANSQKYSNLLQLSASYLFGRPAPVNCYSRQNAELLGSASIHACRSPGRPISPFVAPTEIFHKAAMQECNFAFSAEGCVFCVFYCCKRGFVSLPVRFEDVRSFACTLRLRTTRFTVAAYLLEKIFGLLAWLCYRG
jgi:hypothetical protein